LPVKGVKAPVVLFVERSTSPVGFDPVTVTAQLVEVPATVELGEHETKRVAVVITRLTVTGLLSDPVEPLLSVLVTVMVKLPALVYECVSEVAVPAIPVSVLPSPQLTEKDWMVPSGSVAENATVTVWPVLAGFGETFDTVTVGSRS
jgi:hypothetical protein